MSYFTAQQTPDLDLKDPRPGKISSVFSTHPVQISEETPSPDWGFLQLVFLKVLKQGYSSPTMDWNNGAE
jgi:hypothetical protein